jgi:hypothetical protein
MGWNIFTKKAAERFLLPEGRNQSEKFRLLAAAVFFAAVAMAIGVAVGAFATAIVFISFLDRLTGIHFAGTARAGAFCGCGGCHRTILQGAYVFDRSGFARGKMLSSAICCENLRSVGAYTPFLLKLNALSTTSITIVSPAPKAFSKILVAIGFCICR